MHGRTRPDAPPSPAEVEGLKKKTRAYNAIVSKVFELRAEKLRTVQALEVTSKLLQLNPDFYTVWNYRREILQHLVLGEQPSAEIPDKDALFCKEFALSAETIKRHPKSYPAWFHRKWLVTQWEKADLYAELQLCALFLTKDERNYHCWNYRRFVASRVANCATTEYEFAKEKIDQNFSNYSAYHYRSILIKTLGLQDSLDTYLQEIEVVTQAAFTEPDDQSSWFYHRWLIDEAVRITLSDCTDGQERALSILEKEVCWCEELQEMEPQCKWAMSALAFLHRKKATVYTDREGKQSSWAKAIAFYTALIGIDPTHQQYYEQCIRALKVEIS